MASSSDISLCVEECSFIECYRNGNGGAIYFYYGSNCVLNRICAFQCNTSSNKWGQFCLIHVKDGSQYQNIAHLVSVCKCAQDELSNRYWSICFCVGNVSLNNVNSSANRCKQCSGLIYDYPDISYTTFSTFSNNTDYSQCLMFWYYLNHISQCNILRNHQVSSDYGIIHSYNAQTIFSDCIIDENNGNGKIIYVSSGTVSLTNCYLQSNIQSTGTLSIISPISFSQSLILYHFKSYYCDILNFFPKETFLETPIDTLRETPLETPIDTLRETPLETPIDTLRETPLITPVDTLRETPLITLIDTLSKTPLETLIDTLSKTTFDTPYDTKSKTPFDTLIETSLITLSDTLRETPLETTTDILRETPLVTQIDVLRDTNISSQYYQDLNDNVMIHNILILIITIIIIIVVVVLVTGIYDNDESIVDVFGKFIDYIKYDENSDEISSYSEY